jgi:Rrf2 family nitric oxide-sensitive transcriptional repressor
MKLNKASLFALFAILELASDPERQLSTSDIADKYGISTHHLAKVMRNLVQNGLVTAMRGAGGGYRFAGNVNRMTLLDIIQLFEKLESELDMPNYREHAGDPIVAELQNISDEIDELTKAVLDTITLATALKSTRQRAESGTPDEHPGTGAAKPTTPHKA